MSKHVRQKCEKLCISYILSSKRGISPLKIKASCRKPSIIYILSSKVGMTPLKIDAKWRLTNLICSTFKQSHMQNFSSICKNM